MKRITQVDYLASAGRIGLGWGKRRRGGGPRLDGQLPRGKTALKNVIRVLEDLEDEKYQNLDFVELERLCRRLRGRCASGGNPYIAKAK